MEETTLQNALVGLTNQVSSLTTQVSILVVEMQHLKESDTRVQNAPGDIALIKQELSINKEFQSSQSATNKWLIATGIGVIFSMVMATLTIVGFVLPHLQMK